ncbi:hypothetical protein M231_02319, partial [Tremella mesenterica]
MSKDNSDQHDGPGLTDADKIRLKRLARLQGPDRIPPSSSSPSLTPSTQSTSAVVVPRSEPAAQDSISLSVRAEQQSLDDPGIVRASTPSKAMSSVYAVHPPIREDGPRAKMRSTSTIPPSYEPWENSQIAIIFQVTLE